MSNLRYGYAFPILAALAMAGGCKGSVGPTSQTQRVVQSPGSKTADGKGIVHRFTMDNFAAQREASRNPYVIPAKSMSAVVRSAEKNTNPDATRPIRKEDGKLFLLPNAGEPTVTALLGLGVRAEDYNELRLKMRVSHGDYCRISWTTDVEPSSLRSAKLTIPIFADNEIHTYRVPLGELNTQSWVGLVKSIVLRPSDHPADVEIESMELGFSPPVSPSRATIAAQTHDAVVGTQPAWEVTIPAGAAFSTAIGLPEDTESNVLSPSARFVATLDTDNQKGVLLLDQVLTPKTDESHRAWIPFKADLSKFAGQKARIHFTISGVDGKAPGPGCWGNPMIYATEKENAAVPVILVSCDTLRADHLSCYGYFRETTPHLDAFAKDAVLFENAISVETWTLPSHASMMTGLYPKHHGATPDANIAESTLTLAEAMRDHGYMSGAYVGFTFWLYPWRGFSHGFDVYNTPTWRFRDILETHALAEGWLDALQAPNFFLFLHNFDVHSKPAKQFDGLPYGPEQDEFLHFAKEFANPPTFARPDREGVDAEAFLNAANEGKVTLTQEEIDYCKALYDDSLRMIDSELGQLFAKMKEQGLYDRALIIVTADHGEEFGEHGVFGHANVYEPSLHIPMIVKFPKQEFAGTRVKHIVEQVDIMPTVLDVTGAKTPEGLDGKSLYRILKNEAKPKDYGYSQRFNQKSVREADWKLIRTKPDTYELYNLAQDPSEKNNLAGANPEKVAQLRPQLEEFFKVNPEGWHIAYERSVADPRGMLTVSTEDAIESAELLGRQDVMAMNQYDRMVTLNLAKLDHTNSDELVVRTFGTKGRITLSIKSTTDFSIAVGDQPVAVGKGFRNLLDPTAKEYTEPPAAASDSTKDVGLRFRVWYVPQTGTRSAAQHLSPEEIEELKHLGYTGE
ncbi:MAG: sulfatase [Candidatus Hydrogenedentes bacterium]|nr:sulfatase [Candidatus Hydrogenedentota bacterium]